MTPGNNFVAFPIKNEDFYAVVTTNKISNNGRSNSNRRQGIFWCLTVPGHAYVPYLPEGIRWVRGQRELGAGGFDHWQLVCAFKSKQSLRGVREYFGPYHAKLSRSESANDYVWKEDTRVEGTQFEFGTKPMAINSKVDWDHVWEAATRGDLSTIPAGVRVRSYFALRAIASFHVQCKDMARSTVVYWGGTGLGKSSEVRKHAGQDHYSKDPRTKFWDGYQGEADVIIDEYRGDIAISHLLRWLDNFAVRVEIKGSSVPLQAQRFWITSNIPPRQWYPDLDDDSFAALLRRLTINHVQEKLFTE